jgi:outer membrane murein-binding lipoprotein Lpp
MRIARPEGGSGSKQFGIVASFIGAVVIGTLLVAGCAGNRTGGEAGADAAVTSITTDATNQLNEETTTRAPQTTVDTGSTHVPSTTGPRRSSTTKAVSPTSKKSTSSSTKPTTTSKPAEKPKLTVSIDDRVNAEGAVQVDPGGTICRSTCTYSYSKGTSISLKVTHGLEVLTDWEVSGGQSTCDGRVGSCSLTLNEDTTVTLIFNG